MDTSKSRNQNSNGGAQRPSEAPVGYCKSLVQDIVCFVILFSLAMVMLWAFFYVIDDTSKPQTQATLMQPTPSPPKATQSMPYVVHLRRCYWPQSWCRLIFNCPKRANAVTPAQTLDDNVATEKSVQQVTLPIDNNMEELNALF